MKAHVSEAKKKTVNEFVDLIKEYPIIAAVNMENLPGKQLQNMREQLRGTVVLRMTKRRLIQKAFEEAEKSKPGILKLSEHLKGMPALLFTKDNPFTLFKTLKKNKSKAPIKGGQTAPNVIVVPAGPTSFAPGPIIGELAQFGIKSGVEDGKIAIKADSVVAKEGDVINQKLAGLLARLGIEPMEVGLDLTAAFEDGEIITKAVLDVDEDAYMGMIAEAVSAATNLSFNAAIPTAETINMLLGKASSDAMAIALETNTLTKDTVGLILSKAVAGASSIAGTLSDEVLSKEAKVTKSTHAPSAPVEEKKEEPKEEKKEPESQLA